MSPELAGGFLTTGPTGKPCNFFPVVDSSFTALWSEKVFYMILCFKMYQFNKIKIKCLGAYQAEEAEVDQFYEDLEDLLELKKSPKKDILFITGDWNAKVGNQDISGVTGKFGLREQNEAGQRLTEYCHENECTNQANILFQQHRRQLYTWTSPNGQY